MQRPRDDIAVHGTQSAPAVRVAGEEQRVRELMVEALSAEDPEQHDVVGLRLQHVCDSELQIGLVLLRGERQHRDASRAELGGALEPQRVEIADDRLGKDTPPLERERAAVRRDDEVRALELGAVARIDVAVSDHDGLHGTKKRRIRAPQRGLTRSDSLR